MISKRDGLLIKKLKIKKTKIVKGKKIQKTDKELLRDLKKAVGAKYVLKSRFGKKPSKLVCTTFLSAKISQNIKKKKWPIKQAIAISYSQVKKYEPGCSKYFRKKDKSLNN